MGSQTSQPSPKPKYYQNQQIQMKQIPISNIQIPTVAYVQRPTCKNQPHHPSADKFDGCDSKPKNSQQNIQQVQNQSQKITGEQHKNSVPTSVESSQYFTLGYKDKQTAKQQRPLKQSKQKQNHAPPNISISFANKQLKASKQLPEVRPPKKFVVKKTRQAISQREIRQMRQMGQIKQNLYQQYEHFEPEDHQKHKKTTNIYHNENKEAEFEDLANVTTTKSQSIQLQQILNNRGRTAPLVAYPKDNAILQFGKTKKCRVSRML